MKKLILIFSIMLGLIVWQPFNAHAVDLADYTAYPPFLPRVTSPNILFTLDYYSNMVRL